MKHVKMQYPDLVAHANEVAERSLEIQLQAAIKKVKEHNADAAPEDQRAIPEANPLQPMELDHPLEPGFVFDVVLDAPKQVKNPISAFLRHSDSAKLNIIAGSAAGENPHVGTLRAFCVALARAVRGVEYFPELTDAADDVKLPPLTKFVEWRELFHDIVADDPQYGDLPLLMLDMSDVLDLIYTSIWLEAKAGKEL